MQHAYKRRKIPNQKLNKRTTEIIYSLLTAQFHSATNRNPKYLMRDF